MKDKRVGLICSTYRTSGGEAADSVRRQPIIKPCEAGVIEKLPSNSQPPWCSSCAVWQLS